MTKKNEIRPKQRIAGIRCQNRAHNVRYQEGFRSRLGSGRISAMGRGRHDERPWHQRKRVTYEQHHGGTDAVDQGAGT